MCPLFHYFVQQKQLKDAVKVLSSGGLLFASYLTVVGDERFYANQLMPLLQKVVGAETAHVLAVKLIGLGVVPLNRYRDPPSMVRHTAKHTFGLLTRPIYDSVVSNIIGLSVSTGGQCPWVKVQKPHRDCGGL